MKTLEMGWKVGRRYSDFMWLREYLRKVNPTQVIPPIPEKKASKRTQRHYDKRMSILTFFLNDIMTIPEFRNNRVVIGFLRLTESSAFAKLKEEGEKQVVNVDPKCAEATSGELTIRFDAETKAYM